MQSVVEALEGNKVKLSISVDVDEFEKDLAEAFKRISKEVNLPGFRRGKAPRRLLEARLGSEVGREEALRSAMPKYFAEAVSENNIDTIATPELEITAGQSEGQVKFDAVVEVRPVINVAGYAGLQVTMESTVPSDEEIDARIDRVRRLESTLDDSDQPAQEGDHVIIDITGSLDGETQDGLTTDGYSYEVGSKVITEEVDEKLLGTKAGDHLEFDSVHPDEDETRQLRFVIDVKKVQVRVLPELTDQYAADNSDFATVAEWRASLAEEITASRKLRGAMQLSDLTARALAELVDEDLVPDSLVSLELSNNLQQLSMRLDAQGISFEQYVMMTGGSPQAVMDTMSDSAKVSARVDLALRAVATAEGLEPEADDLDNEIHMVAERVGQSEAKVRKRFEETNQIPAILSDLKKRLALKWLTERVSIVDSDGHPLDRSDFDLGKDVDDDHAHHDHDH